MCGIFGYVGTHTAGPILLEGLRTLEYRGYDSAGIYIPKSGVVKAAGPIDNLAAAFDLSTPGTSGIAHTRWATHGAPSVENAHPHHDMSGQLWIAHNGIIENYRELREGLVVRGITFYSETDTEILAKLIGTFYSGDLRQAVMLALQSVRGTYGLVVMHDRQPGEIVAARLGSPIVIGLGTDGNYVASDPSALLVHTKDVVYLNDGDVARVTKSGYDIKNIVGQKQDRPAERIDWEMEAVQKGGYEHFMLKEIHDCSTVIQDTIRGRLLIDKGRAKLGGLEQILPRLSQVGRLEIVGCGSAYYAGAVGKWMLETYAGLPTTVELGSEYRYRRLLPEKNTAALFISQSGETADTRAALELAKSGGRLTLGVVNVVGSAIARQIDAGVHNHAGPEVAVASTKAFISQLAVMALITLFLGRDRDISLVDGKVIAEQLEALPEVLARVLTLEPEIARLAQKYASYRDFVYLGRGSHLAVALEGALKLKEVSYVHAEGYAGGELKHGPIAMLDKDFPVFALAPKDAVYEKMLSNISEVKARQAPVIAIGTEGDSRLSELVDDLLLIPKVHPLLQPIVTTVPLHLFAYYVGKAKGLDVDRPRNLAKSVTVE